MADPQPGSVPSWRELMSRLAAPGAAPARRVTLLVGSALVLILVLAVGVRLWGGASEMEQGIAEFEAGRTGVAERHFRAALEDEPASVTAQLYLARIAREQGRYDEAATLLRAAVAAEPRDAGVRRELGWLFMDLRQGGAAAEQFRQATELEPSSTAAWVGLVQALRLAGDPAADDVLRRAPEEARVLLMAPRTP